MWFQRQGSERLDFTFIPCGALMFKIKKKGQIVFYFVESSIELLYAPTLYRKPCRFVPDYSSIVLSVS